MDGKQGSSVIHVNKSFCWQYEEWIEKTEAHMGQQATTLRQKFLTEAAVQQGVVTEVDTEIWMGLWDRRWYNKKKMMIDQM